MPTPVTTRRVVVTSLLVDLFDIVSNMFVTIFTNSAVIFAEMAQGIADGTGSALVVIGFWRASRPPSPEYPLGHQREVFFWALLAGLAILVLGGGLSAWRGYHQVVDPRPLERIPLALGILVVSICTNGYALSLSVRRLRQDKIPLLQAFRASRRPLVNTSLIQDGLGTLSSILGLAALLIYAFAKIEILDGVGALLVAGVMVVTSLTLVNQARHLIAGRAVPRRVRKQILRSVREIPAVETVNELTAVFGGAHHIEVDVDLDVREDLTTVQIEQLLDRVEAAVKAAAADVGAVRIDLNSPAAGG